MSSLPLHFKDGVPAILPVGYRHLEAAKPEMLTIFLHGYADHGGSFTRRLFPDGYPSALAETAALIPNGPFPVPVKTEDGWREAYAWYFFDDAKQKMVISPETAINGIMSLVSEFGYDRVPKAIVGFSQGGYLAPYLAKRLHNVVTLVGIGTGYRTDYFEPLANDASLAPSVHAIHGAGDPVFPLETAKASHQKVVALGFRGNFHSVDKGTHVANEAMGKILSEILLNERARLS